MKCGWSFAFILLQSLYKRHGTEIRTLVGDMEQFGAIVMAEDTWNVILQVSERVPWSKKSRMNTFVDDLLLILERKENETGDPFSVGLRLVVSAGLRLAVSRGL